MKTGDKVKVIWLEYEDIADTNLNIGDTGEIKSELFCNDGQSDDVFHVDFGESFVLKNAKANDVHSDGTYSMCRNQLEVVEDVEE